MIFEDRARRAAGGIRRAVDAARPVGSPELALERFDRYRERRSRNQRVGAGLLAAILTAGAIVVVARAFEPARQSPASPFPGGWILYGRWHPRLQQAEWFTVRSDGSAANDLDVTATCAVWFPDGKKILITNDAAVRTGSPLRPAIVSAGGSGLRALDGVRDPHLNLGCGDVSPDGGRLVLEGFGRDGTQGIYSVRASDGGDLERLTNGSDANPRYSPDGRRIVFFRSRPGVSPQGAGALFVANADGSAPRRIVPWGFAFLYYDWSPDGTWIAFERPYGRLYLVHPDGSGLQEVPLRLPPGSGASNPSWSPDGRWIVFAIQHAGGGDIYAARLDGTGLRKITGMPDVEEQAPDWGGGR